MSKSSSQEGSVPQSSHTQVIRVALLLYSDSEINLWYNYVKCSKGGKASQHLKGTVNNPMKTATQHTTSLHYHSEVGVQGKQDSLKETAELVRDKSNATRMIRICFHTGNNQTISIMARVRLKGNVTEFLKSLVL